MKLLSEYLNENCQLAYGDFNTELSTDENKDYRRGFRAGVLFAFLQIKSELGNFENDILKNQVNN